MDLVTGSSDANLINKWDQNLKTCQQTRINFEKQWHENLSFYYGRQWIVTSKAPGGGYTMVEQTPTNKWRVRHTANRILRVIRSEVTKLSKEEPQFYCQPASTEEKDRLAAMAGDAIAEYILRTKYFNRKRLEATFWACLCGTSYIKNFYDPNKLELDGQPGKIDFEAVTAFHLFVPNLQTTDIQEQPYVIHARTMSPEDVWASYGVELPPGTDSSALIIDQRFLTSVGIKSPKAGESKQCYVKEVYAKPCKDYPNGMMVVYGENKVLYVYEPPELPEMGGEFSEMAELMPGLDSAAPPVGNSAVPETSVGTSESSLEIEPPKSIFDGVQDYNFEYPYRHGRYPFVKIDHIPTGMYYAESVIKSLIPLQKEYNRTRSIMLEHRNLAGKPQWSYVAGAFDPRKFNSQPGLLLPVNMGFDPPLPLAQPELSASVSQELTITISDMDDAASQSEVSKGGVPPGVEAASAIAYLSEENDTSLFHTVQSLENAVQETGIQVLANVHDYWDESRIVQMTSKNQFMEVRQFKAQDLNPVTDFRVETNSMAPRSIAAKQAFITELMKMGAIEPTKALRYLQMNETNKLYDEMMLDVRHAQRENVAMSQGQPLYKIDPNGQPPVDEMTGMPQIDPMTGQPVPAFKMDTIRDPMTGQPQIDPMTGQPRTYQVTINPFDAHEVHIEEHQSFQKSQEYELLPPEIKQIVQDHTDEHKMEMIKERTAIQADAAVKQGIPEDTTPPPRELESASPNGQTQGAY